MCGKCRFLAGPGQRTFCCRESLRVADGPGARTVAFPALFTGARGRLPEDAARIAAGAVCETDTGAEEVRFVLVADGAHAAFAARIGRPRC